MPGAVTHRRGLLIVSGIASNHGEAVRLDLFGNYSMHCFSGRSRFKRLAACVLGGANGRVHLATLIRRLAAHDGAGHVAGEIGGENKVLQIASRGAIMEGASPLLGAAGGTVSMVHRALRYAKAEGAEGILLYIDSPGGGVTDSDRIYQMLRRFRCTGHIEKKYLP